MRIPENIRPFLIVLGVGLALNSGAQKIPDNDARMHQSANILHPVLNQISSTSVQPAAIKPMYNITVNSHGDKTADKSEHLPTYNATSKILSPKEQELNNLDALPKSPKSTQTIQTKEPRENYQAGQRPSETGTDSKAPGSVYKQIAHLFTQYIIQSNFTHKDLRHLAPGIYRIKSKTEKLFYPILQEKPVAAKMILLTLSCLASIWATYILRVHYFQTNK